MPGFVSSGTPCIYISEPGPRVKLPEADSHQPRKYMGTFTSALDQCYDDTCNDDMCKDGMCKDDACNDDTCKDETCNDDTFLNPSPDEKEIEGRGSFEKSVSCIFTGPIH
jgi:hypothetical protein